MAQLHPGFSLEMQDLMLNTCKQCLENSPLYILAVVPSSIRCRDLMLPLVVIY